MHQGTSLRTPTAGLVNSQLIRRSSLVGFIAVATLRVHARAGTSDAANRAYTAQLSASASAEAAQGGFTCGTDAAFSRLHFGEG